MKKINIGIIDYNSGNQNSLLYCLRKLGFNPFISKDINVLSTSDIMILPGVGAFPKAMQSLKKSKLDKFICDWGKNNKPIIGICLGMHLLTEASYEFAYTKGLGLIEGECIELSSPKFHIGWNSVKVVKISSYLEKYNDNFFYFNHSYFYNGPREFELSVTTFNNKFASIIISKNIIGLQFHPEKSQEIGERLLESIIYKLNNA